MSHIKDAETSLSDTSPILPLVVLEYRYQVVGGLLVLGTCIARMRTGLWYSGLNPNGLHDTFYE